MLNVWAREGSPQSPQLCAPTAQVQALPVTPFPPAVNCKKMMHLLLDNNVLWFLTPQSIQSDVGLCKARHQQHISTSALPR